MGRPHLSIKKAVIPAAGLGTRLLPVTKEIPKEMLPMAMRKGRATLMKPMMQAVFEQLYGVGVRDFCIITGRGKREIEDHFTADWAFLELLKPSVWKSDLESFYRQLETTRIYFVSQSRKRGFGDAVLLSEEFVAGDLFLVHAGDDIVNPGEASYLPELSRLLQEEGAEVVLLVEEVPDPRGYGVVSGKPLSRRLIEVSKIEEKPPRPTSRLAVIAIYAFRPSIFRAIRSSDPGANGEIQVTSGIQALVDEGRKVLALKIRSGDRRIDVGSAEGYIRALAKKSG